MFYGYPSNYWIKAYEGIARVSKDDVEDAASKYLHPDGIKILMLGPTEE
jgi:predicted Zn-dependent peptidase